MNPQSLNADAVVVAARQGYAPATWKVFHGRVAHFVRQIIAGLIILLLGFAGMIYLLLNPNTAVVPGAGGDNTPIDPGPFMVARTVDFVVLALLLLLGLGYSVYASSQLPAARDQLLVLMPDGFVISTRKSVAYAYAAMQAMSARSYRGTVTFSITPVGGARHQSFRLDGRFGNAKQLATQMLAARREWQRSHSEAQPPQFPQPPAPGAIG